MNPAILRIYYRLRPVIPRRLQLALRREVVFRQLARSGDMWPIDPEAGRPPENWNGWPDGKRFALVLTHDVDTQKGHDRCRDLLALEKALGFRSSFNFVAKRYIVSAELRTHITSSGFEVGVHGLYHDGRYFDSCEEFFARSIEINQYLKSWGAVGYRMPAMHHNLDWLLGLDMEYDCSTFDTDPFEPQADGMRTIFPFWYTRDDAEGRGYVELPYTLPQDFTMFVLLREKTIDIWKRKLDWIAERGGMALLNVHPDYIRFDGGRPGIEEYPVRRYEEFLEYVERVYKGRYWHVLPREMASYWVRERVTV